MGGPSLPDRVAQCYYTHGLFCSSHPIVTISVAISCFLLCCYPLFNIPLPGSIPTKVSLPYNHHESNFAHNNVTNASKIQHDSSNCTNDQNKDPIPNEVIKLSELMNETFNLPHLWAKEEPLLYIQQIILKTGVWPWREELRLSDAFRAPLQEVFRLLETIRNHHYSETDTSLGQICFHVENVKRNVANHVASPILPEYTCLVLSPANLWQQNLDRFSLDKNILATVFNHQNLQKGKVSMAEMVFGMHLKDTGIKRYPLRARPRALQYAITLFFSKLDERFIETLKEKLSSVYPMHHKWDKSQPRNEITLIYYPGEFNYREFVPLCITFFGLFLYIYFSVRKIEFIQSKIGLSISAVISVAASLVMSVGFCFFFGLTLSFQGKEIFPYLVILVGLENVFVLTKSVMSIDSKLDVKIRLAQGLSKEGWSITKNLLTEITILTISLFTFVPVIQQFSIFMIVSLLSDYFLQMIFFTTVLGIDIRRKEKSRETSDGFQFRGLFNTGPGKFKSHDFTVVYKVGNQEYSLVTSQQPIPKMLRSKSHPKLNGLTNQPHTNVVANNYHNPKLVNSGSNEKKVPKRIRLVNIWARTRFFQRAFMVWMIVWISMIIYSSGLFEHVFESIPQTDELKSEKQELNGMGKNVVIDVKVLNDSARKLFSKKSVKDAIFMTDKHQGDTSGLHQQSFNMSIIKNESIMDPNDLENIEFNSEILNKSQQFISLKHLAYPQPWLRLSEFHWSSVLAQYNVSVSGQYIALLPPLLVKHRVTPEAAIAVRNPAEKDSMPPPSRWHALAAALDPLDLSDFEIEDRIHIPHVSLHSNWGSPQSSTELPYYPTSPMEILLLAMLCAISVLVIAYMMVVLYRCVCTRNYAEWRASWSISDVDKRIRKQPALQLIMKAVPIVIPGHSQEVECLVTDGEYIVSSCLQGQLKIWDSSSGELTARIDRRMFFRLKNDMYERLHRKEKKSGTDETETQIKNNPDSEVSLRKRFAFINSNIQETSDQNNVNNNSPSKDANVKRVRSQDWKKSVAEKMKYDFAMQFRKLSESNKSNSINAMKIFNFNENSHCFNKSSNLNPSQNLPHSSDDGKMFIREIKSDIKKFPYGLSNSKKDDSFLKSENFDICDKPSAVILKNEPNEDSAPCSLNNFNVNSINSSIHRTDRYEIETVPQIQNKCPSKETNDVDECLNSKINSLRDSDNEDGLNSLKSYTLRSISAVSSSHTPPAIWCMDFLNNLIAIGCSDGRLEFWEASTGKFKCLSEAYGGSVNHVRLMEGTGGAMFLAVARLTGHLDLFQLQYPSPCNNAFKRTHVRTGSAGSLPIGEPVHNRYNAKAHISPNLSPKSSSTATKDYTNFSFNIAENEGAGEHMQCFRVAVTRAHQQPINVMECDSGRILTGSEDHTLKVFSANNLSALYTLHGHCGPITCVFIDRFSPMVSGSGSQDGLLCVWDLMTGACVYTIQAHDGPISALDYTASYVMSMGADERLCIWDRFRGHLLNSVHIGQGAGGCGMLTLTHSLVITGGKGGLTVWDASTGEAVRRVFLGHNDGCVFVRQILPLKDAIVCDYANQLRIVRFPLVTKVEESEDMKSK